MRKIKGKKSGGKSFANGGRNFSRGSKSVSRPEVRPKKAADGRTEAGKFFLVKTVSGPDGMRLVPRGEDFPYALAAGKSSDQAKLKKGFLALARQVGVGKTGSKKGVPVVKVEKIIGRAGEFAAEKKAIEHKYSLPGKFPQAVVRQSGEAYRLACPGREDRVDLRGKTVFTIDGEDAKDFDDAVGIRKKGSGFTLWVCIADVSHYVKKGSPLDAEAARRCSSVYLDNRVIPMLPEALSNDLCSLVPKRDRLTKTVEMDFSADGLLGNFHIYNSVIKSARRLTYGEVNDFFEKGRNSEFSPKIRQSLIMMKRLYEAIKKQSLKNGELDFDLPEAEIVRDSKGVITDVRRAERGTANMIIEQFMIAANRAVGMRLGEDPGLGVYRIHEPPTETSVSELAGELGRIGYKFDAQNSSVSSAIQKLLADFKGKKQESAVKMMTLKSFQRAVYSTREAGHFGLAVGNYTHFTSPIRRYPDIIAHRMIDSIAAGKSSQYSPSALEQICERASVIERNCEKAERETVNLETANFMKTLIGRTFTGRVSSVLPFGMFVELNEICAEGFVPREKMTRGGRRKWFAFGEPLKLRVTGANLEKRRTVMEPI